MEVKFRLFDQKSLVVEEQALNDDRKHLADPKTDIPDARAYTGRFIYEAKGEYIAEVRVFVSQREQPQLVSQSKAIELSIDTL